MANSIALAQKFLPLIDDIYKGASVTPVSYTHLDVYKRQVGRRLAECGQPGRFGVCHRAVYAGYH